MILLLRRAVLSALLLVAFFSLPHFVLAQNGTALELLGRYETGLFDEGAAEIVAYDAPTQRLFFVNAESNDVVVLDISDPANPIEVFTLDPSDYGNEANSVAISNGLVAVAVEADPSQDPGQVVFYDTDGNALAHYPVGALPDAVVFTPDGTRVIVANEGEPNDDYDVDPEGSVSIIDISAGVNSGGVTSVGFADFNADGSRASELPAEVRIFGPNATVAQDLEPEYIAVSQYGSMAYVTLQENNALAIIDVEAGTVQEIVSLGFKDHSLAENRIDASNRDDAVNFQTWPVLGMYQPDAIAAYSHQGTTYLVTANEGDARDYDAFSEEERVEDLTLDPDAYPDAATLQMEENLGRLNSTTATGDTDGDGDIDQIYAYGARSFSIWTADGTLVYDSADDFERITAERFPNEFNATNDENDTFDNRSDDKGPEPEGIVLGTVGMRTYAFIGLERIGGVMVYDVTDPLAPVFLDYVTSRDFTGDAEAGTAGDLGPEGLAYIPAADSPNGQNLLVVSNEVSGSVAIFAFTAT
ncbi:MAG TPA: choice-of-anchor I family protein, partial [Rhodothermales bacterium]|nr:choice-of-anchor I family protein [Rhodothermales bacterium]